MTFIQANHERNMKNINTLADNTKAKVLQWYSYCTSIEFGVLIYEAIRTKATQRQYVNSGKSQTMKSYHIVGQAIDFVPADGKTALWNGYESAKAKKAIAYAKKIGFEWGGDWTSFVDKPHLQFNYKGYGTDTFGKKATVATTIVAATTNDAKEEAVKPTQYATSKGQIGIVEIKKEIWLYKEASLKGETHGRKLKVGGKFKAYKLENGMYNLGGDQWCNAGKDYVEFTPVVELPNTVLGVVTLKNKANVYEKADKNSKVVKTLNKGTAWKCYAKENGFYEVSTNMHINVADADIVANPLYKK